MKSDKIITVRLCGPIVVAAGLWFVMFSFAAESFFRYLSILVEDARLLVKRLRGQISKEEFLHELEGEELDG